MGLRPMRETTKVMISAVLAWSFLLKTDFLWDNISF